jgi:type II secretory pathway predicted ATPase ExeA
MYNEYWGFNRSPFSGTIDPERFYESPGHEEALARLSYVADEGRQGAVVLGSAGVGKTLLLETFARRIRRPNREVVIARCPALGGRELFFDLCQDFGLAPEPLANEAELWRRLRDHVVANRLQDCQTMIVIDQAHLMAENPTQLRAMHMLFHLDPHPAARLTVVLAARPELMRVARPEVIEWVDLGVAIDPFTAAQTSAYVSHLTNWAGRSESAFSPNAVAKIHELTGGVPRHINRVCDLGLLAAATEELTEVSEEVVESVYKELSPETTAGPLSIAV